MHKFYFDVLNNSGKKLFFAITGGGQSIVSDYLSFSGASRSFMGAMIPYNREIFNDFVGNNKLDTYASEQAATQLAVAAYFKVLRADKNPENAIGIGAASSIAYDGERAGRIHRVHIAIQTYDKSHVLNIIFVQGRTREEENQLISDWIFKLLYYAIIGGEFETPSLDQKIKYELKATNILP
jgi:nicotinamide mononucleotide (NMN) deamidase PncC